ncbi:Methyltransferase ustM [Pseudocercospora fuligena]|uniref:Methyltransferase ustM n=1 Tax=Pseudocercospora fuligena TaxID=685502 RepID=A0A8H6VG19_9PEZI|nr:Methyltransferase ustM [Pseudocercospora fuligena]
MPLSDVAPDRNKQKDDRRRDEVDRLLTNFLIKERHRERIFRPRFQLRLDIATVWAIEAGSSILDIGCGQGESSITLALRLGPGARIVGIDTAVPGYGSPHTVAEAWNFISSTEFGQQITYVRTDAETMLAGHDSDEQPPRFDAATLCLSLWYFPTPASVASLFQALAGAGISRVYVAEYDFAASKCAQMPHVLAARVQAQLHTSKGVHRVADPREPNIRAALEASDIRRAASDAKFAVVREGHLSPAEDMLEAHLEVQYVLSADFEAAVRKEKLAQEEEILAGVSMVRKALDELDKDEKMHSQAMDIWWAEMCLDQKP